MFWKTLCSVLLFWFFLQTESAYEDEDLTKCLQFFSNRTVLQDTYLEILCSNFTNIDYASNYTNSSTLDQEILDYMDRLLGPFYDMGSTGLDRTIRKEYRLLTDEEREDYHRAVQMLKLDTSVPPNKYDAIGLLHTKTVSPGAHRGPAFPGWHRIYLVLFERAIKEMVPTAILPYWDSSLDSYLNQPERSVIFSEHFAGNPDGDIVEGPFKDFIGYTTGKLHRKVGKTGKGWAITPLYISNIFSQMKTEDITFPSAFLNSSLEEAHNDVHSWVGGQMGKIATSADDPLFFVHHCFIDYLWSHFRKTQTTNGINPEFDFPLNSSNIHHPLADMRPFDKFKNIHGYSNYWTDFVFDYEKSPTCSPEQPTCLSKWLHCKTDVWKCVSKPVDLLKWIV